MTISQILALIAPALLLAGAAYWCGRMDGYWNRAAEERARLDRYRRAVDDLDRWCGHEFPHARLIATHLHAVGEGHGLNAGTPAGDEPCTISGLRDQLRRLQSESGTSGVPADPMDWPLPCDVRVGHGVMRKGVRLGTLVARMKVLYEMATGANADEVAARTLEQRQALFDASGLAGASTQR